MIFGFGTVSNQVIVTNQNKTLQNIVDARWYVWSKNIHRDLGIERANQERKVANTEASNRNLQSPQRRNFAAPWSACLDERMKRTKPTYVCGFTELSKSQLKLQQLQAKEEQKRELKQRNIGWNLTFKLISVISFRFRQIYWLLNNDKV